MIKKILYLVCLLIVSCTPISEQYKQDPLYCEVDSDCTIQDDCCCGEAINVYNDKAKQCGVRCAALCRYDGGWLPGTIAVCKESVCTRIFDLNHCLTNQDNKEECYIRDALINNNIESCYNIQDNRSQNHCIRGVQDKFLQ